MGQGLMLNKKISQWIVDNFELLYSDPVLRQIFIKKEVKPLTTRPSPKQKMETEFRIQKQFRENLQYYCELIITYLRRNQRLKNYANFLLNTANVID